ncbi:MAG: hypothetical protein ASARMPRED_005751 [Alectoria sarmentosa]|nr:MAG: hypothetical protein ASARMPRED_005751 [Alectoria sarmentosa]
MSLVVSSRFPVALSNYLAALNVSFPTNVTDANSIVVEGCGDEMQNVNCAYNLARAAANVAKADVFRGTDSPFGFSAMFKSDRSKYPRTRTPLVLPVSIRTVQLYTKDFNWVTILGNAAAIHGLPKGRRRPAPAGNHCPTVVDNTFVGDVNVFYRNYQMYTLIYELIRFYLQKKSLGIKSLPKEVFDWNHCVAYSVESSLKNPTNLLLYIALAQQQCLEAPNPSEPPFAPPSRTTTLPAVNM